MRKGYKTQWVGQYAVASELTRRNNFVSMPLGNIPDLDLQCQNSYSKRKFSVQVKSLSSKTSFPIQNRLIKKEIPGLYFVFVYVPPEESKPLEYFVLNHEQFLNVWKKGKEDIKERNKKRKKKGLKPIKERGEGIHFKFLGKYRGKWRILPH